MATYRFYNPVPVIFDIQGLRPAIGGSLTFYEKGTGTPKATHSDQAGTVPNDNPLPLDGSGRPQTDIWLTGSYTVVAKTAGGVVIDEADIDTPVPPGISLPAPAAGKFIQGNGTQWVAVDLFLLPDPTGSDGYAVVASGGGYGLAPFPSAPTVPIENEAGNVKVGTYMRQWATGTAPAAPSAKTSSVNITFAEAFSATPYHASVTISNAGGSTPSGAICTVAVTNLTATGMTVTVNVPDDDSNSSWKLANSTPFTYAVDGPCVSP